MRAEGLHTPFWTEGTFFRAEFYRPFCSVSLLMLSNFFKIKGAPVAFFGVKNSTNFLLFSASF
jgi:hypothetical protein